MRANYQRLGNYIRQVDVRNKAQDVSLLLGLSIEKKFITSIANTIGTDMSSYKIVVPMQFAYVPVTSRNGDKITIALYKGEERALISQAYTAFEITNTDALLPDYLMLWFKRPEFDRYARFKSHGSAREVFDWDEMCNVMLPVPPIEEQRRIVDQYQAVETRIRNNERLIARLEDTAQSIFRHHFVDNIDLNNLPNGWSVGVLGDIAEYSRDKIECVELDPQRYISTENMLKDRGGISLAETVPSGKCVRFNVNDILISNIRPYFKKIWRCTFDGGCSADVLCIRTKTGFYPEYTYSIVERDHFFDYVTAGCKGTKMPRGDKEWIMKYEIPIPSSNEMDLFHREVKGIRDFIVHIRRENSLLSEASELLITRL